MIRPLPITLNNLCAMVDETSSKTREELKRERGMDYCRPMDCRPLRRILLSIILPGLVLVLTGCRSGEKLPAKVTRPDYDPLLDGSPSAPPPAPVGSPSAKKDSRDPLPLNRDPGRTTSTAALTNLNSGDGRQTGLRIGGGSSARATMDPPKDVWRDPAETGVSLQQPEALRPTARKTATGDPAPPPRPADVALAAGTITSRIGSVDQGMIQLQRLGARTKLESLSDGQWRVIASVPQPENPTLFVRRECVAHDSLTAMRGVLAQIESAQLNGGGGSGF